MLSTLSKLNRDSLKSIRKLEGELGKPLLAFSCYKLKPAKLSKEELTKIKRLEKELGLSLVAVGK
jgi:hypothetical protein